HRTPNILTSLPTTSGQKAGTIGKKIATASQRSSGPLSSRGQKNGGQPPVALTLGDGKSKPVASTNVNVLNRGTTGAGASENRGGGAPTTADAGDLTRDSPADNSSSGSELATTNAGVLNRDSPTGNTGSGGDPASTNAGVLNRGSPTGNTGSGGDAAST